MSYIFKPPRPITDYYIGRYATGECIYLITKEAYTNWKEHGANVRHTAYTKGGGADYPLRGGANYAAHKFENIDRDWYELIRETCPYIALAFEQMSILAKRAKSEPTPDAHYILYRGEDKTYYVMNRELPIGKTTNAPRWDGKNAQQTHVMVFITGDQIDRTTWHKKFPQLSSDVKTELQKLNPTRYREWEQFYMKKYPNFQPLREQDALPSCGCGKCKSCLKRIPLPSPKDDYIAVSANGTVALVRRAVFKPGESVVYDAVHGWKISIVKDYYDRQEDVLGLIKELRMCDGIKAITKEFEQYYTALEQVKVAERQPWFKGINPRNWIFAFGLNAGAFRDKIYLISALNFHMADCHSSDCLSVSNGQRTTMEHTKASHRRFLAFDKLDSGDRAQLIKQAGIELVKYFDFVYNISGKTLHEALGLKGSDLDFYKKVMAADYQDTIDKINQEKRQQFIQPNKVRGKEASWIIHEEAGPFKDASDFVKAGYLAAYDPYKPTNNESVVSVWGKDLNGKLINRTSELKKKQDLFNAFNHQITAAEYYKLLMNDSVSGIVSIKPRRVGQTAFYKDVQEIAKYYFRPTSNNQQFYTPNLKQQNNEAINLSGKTIIVIRGQSLSRNFIQSQRSQPTVAAGYTQYRPGVINCPKKLGSIHVGTPI